MELFFTDNEFKVLEVGIPGVPILVDSEMRLATIPNRFLYHQAVIRGRTESPHTWRTYGSHLYEYLSFLEENGLAWDEVNETHLAAWRISMFERGNKQTTVNQRLRLVQKFYQWAVIEAHISSLPFDTEDVWVAKPKGFMAHTDATGNRIEASELTTKEKKKHPKFLHIDQAIEFIKKLTPQRLQLMAYTILLCGLRRIEVCTLNIDCVPNPAGNPSSRGLWMTLDPINMTTKGAKERNVIVPYDLAVSLWRYKVFDRPKLAKKHLAKYTQEPESLFLSKYGDPLSPGGLDKDFGKFSKKCGIKCTPHILRHTYATYEFHRMSEHKGADGALVWLRDRLGHTSVTTTEVYIHAADLVKHEELDGYILEVCDALRGAKPW